MEAPPPYYSPPPKKNKTGLIVGLVVGGLLLCCVGPILLLGGGGYWLLGKVKSTVACTISFSDLGKAVLDYAHDHKGKLPDAKSWQSEVKSYYAKRASHHKDTSGFITNMDSNSTWGCTDESGKITGIAFNSDLSGKSISDVKDPYATILIYEIPVSSMNANGPYKPQPIDSSPQIMGKPRGWYIAHVDGSVFLHSPQGDHDAGNAGISIQTDSESKDDSPKK